MIIQKKEQLLKLLILVYQTVKGSIFPSFGILITNWVTQNEKSRLLSITTSGITIGNILIGPVSGYLCVEGFDDGWPSIFYITGKRKN
jgi:MFS family permease